MIKVKKLQEYLRSEPDLRKFHFSVLKRDNSDDIIIRHSIVSRFFINGRFYGEDLKERILKKFVGCLTEEQNLITDILNEISEIKKEQKVLILRR